IPKNTILSNGSLGRPGTSSTSPRRPVTKPLAMRPERRPASRKSTRPATPRGGRSPSTSAATSTSVASKSSLRNDGCVKRRSTSTSARLRAAALGERLGRTLAVVRHAIEHAIDERAALLRSEALGDLDRFVEDHRARHVGAMRELPSSQTQEAAIDARHALEPPVLARRAQARVGLLEVARDAAYELVGIGAILGIARSLAPVVGNDAFGGTAANVESEQHLQRGFPRRRAYTHRSTSHSEMASLDLPRRRVDAARSALGDRAPSEDRRLPQRRPEECSMLAQVHQYPASRCSRSSISIPRRTEPVRAIPSRARRAPRRTPCCRPSCPRARALARSSPW